MCQLQDEIETYQLKIILGYIFIVFGSRVYIDNVYSNF